MKTELSMDPEVKAEWTKRLRSGKIAQGERRLGQRNGSRCCLGVLSDIAVERGICEVSVVLDGSLEYDGEKGLPPRSVIKMAHPDLQENKTLSRSFSFNIFAGTKRPGSDNWLDSFSLAELNDVGFKFDQIADVIAYFF